MCNQPVPSAPDAGPCVPPLIRATADRCVVRLGALPTVPRDRKWDCCSCSLPLWSSCSCPWLRRRLPTNSRRFALACARVREALAYIFIIRASGMLVGPVLGGMLLQFGDYPAPGLVFAVLIALFALLTLCPVESVKHDDAEKSTRIVWTLWRRPSFILESSLPVQPPEQVIAPLASFGECDLFLMLDPAPYLSFVPLRTDVLCVLMLFLSTTGLHTLRNSAPCPWLRRRLPACSRLSSSRIYSSFRATGCLLAPCSVVYFSSWDIQLVIAFLIVLVAL